VPGTALLSWRPEPGVLYMHLRFQDTDHTEMRNHRDPLGICLCGDLREGCAHARLKLAEALPSARAQLWIPRAHSGELLGEALRDLCVRKSTPGTYVALAKARFKAGRDPKTLARDLGGLRGPCEVA